MLLYTLTPFSVMCSGSILSEGSLVLFSEQTWDVVPWFFFLAIFFSKLKYIWCFHFPSLINLIIPHLLSLFITHWIFILQFKRKIPLGHLIPSSYQLAIAIYLQGLLPPANAICGSHEHISVLLPNPITTDFSLCGISLMKTCRLLLFIALTSENFSLDWYDTFQCCSWRVSRLVFLFIYLFWFRHFKFLI